jgi:hypothetical protein
LAALALTAWGCGPDGPPEPVGGEPAVWFEEVAEAAGIAFEHLPGRSGRFLFPEIMTGGGAWLDYDGDGDLDLYLVQAGTLDSDAEGGPGNHLYRNDGSGRFVDSTRSARVGDTGYGMGATVGDFDGDGDPDLYVTNVGANVLYRNEGDGGFTDVSREAGVDHPGWGASAGFVDPDLDGDLDLFVVNYLNWTPRNEIECYNGERQRDYCGPTHYKAPASDVFYRNDGSGRFTDASREAGLEGAFGSGLGLAFGDFDGDGLPDVYVANDGMANQLWINDGAGGFEEQGLLSGTALNVAGSVEAGMGVQAFDVESDGDLDLFMTHMWAETNTLYLNSSGIFEDATAAMGLAAPSYPMTGFGVGFADFDHDGRLDLHVVNGGVSRSKTPFRDDDPFAEPNFLFRGVESGFEEVPGAGTDPPLIDNSRAAAFGDYDNDGDVDVAVVSNGGPARLLANRADRPERAVAFLAVGPAGAPAVGSQLRLEAAGRVRFAAIEPVYSYCAASSPTAHFGLGEVERIDSVTVTVPGGGRTVFRDLPAGRSYRLPAGGRETGR